MTSFADLMNKKDIMALQDNLKPDGNQFEVEGIFIKDFTKESIFTDTLRLVCKAPLCVAF